MSDAAAEQANEMVQHRYGIIKETEEAERIAFTVAKRIASLQAHTWETQGDEAIYEAPEIVEPVAPNPSAAPASAMLTLVRNEHRLRRLGNGFLHCDNCKKRRAATKDKYWLNGKFSPIVPAHLRVQLARSSREEVPKAQAEVASDYPQLEEGPAAQAPQGAEVTCSC